MPAIGVDFGNFKTCVGAFGEKGQVEILNKIPSYVSFSNKIRLTGLASKKDATANYENTFFCFKRLLGRKFTDSHVTTESNYLFHSLIMSRNDDNRLLFKVNYMNESHLFTCEQITAVFLNRLKLMTQLSLEMSKTFDFVLSVPCYMTHTQRQALLDACKIAGLNCLKLMNEPTAVALAYARANFTNLPERYESPRRLVVVDMGYTHVQVSAFAVHKDKMKVIAHTFDSNLGGRDFDHLLCDHFIATDERGHGPVNYSADRIRLRKMCEKLKRRLYSAESSQDEAPIQKRNFETMAQGLFNRVRDTCLRLLQEADLKPDQIDCVQLVGGCACLPPIGEIVRDVFNREPELDVEQNACTRGCTIMCAMLNSSLELYEIEECQLFAVKIAGKQSDAQILNQTVFEKHESVPAYKELNLFQWEPTEIELKYIDQFESDRLIGAYFLGSDGSNDVRELNLLVQVDHNGMLNISVDGLYDTQFISLISLLNQEEIEKFSQQESIMTERDLDEMKMLDLKFQFLDAIRNLKQTLREEIKEINDLTKLETFVNYLNGLEESLLKDELKVVNFTELLEKLNNEYMNLKSNKRNKCTSKMYIKNGQILYDEDAKEALENKILNEKAERILKKLLEDDKTGSSSDKDKDHNNNDDKGNRNRSSLFEFDILNANCKGAMASSRAYAKLGTFHALNANAQGAVANASARAKLANVNALNANATGASANASLTANAISANVANVNVQGASASVSANATGVSASAGNVSVTGVDVSVSANVTGAQYSVGNVSVTGCGAGAHASVVGTGVSAFNVSVGGPKAQVDVGISGGVSFGNIDIGLTPTLNFGLGFDLGIPFLGSGNKGSAGGAQGTSAGKNKDNPNPNDPSDPNGNQDASSATSGEQTGTNNQPTNNTNNQSTKGFLDQMRERFPNRKIELDKSETIFRGDNKPVKFEKNNEKQPANEPHLNEKISHCGADCEQCENIQQPDNEKNDWKYVGERGTASERYKQLNDPVYGPPTENEARWSGLYTTNNPSIAAGYTEVTYKSGNTYKTEIQPINRVYVNPDTKIYETKTPMDLPDARVMVDEINRQTSGNYVFGGPIDSKNPDLIDNEFVTRADQSDVHFMPSVHSSSNGSEVNEYHDRQLAEKVIPDFIASCPDDERFNGRNFDNDFQNGERVIEMYREKKQADADASKRSGKLENLVRQKLHEKGLQLNRGSHGSSKNGSNIESNDDDLFEKCLQMSLDKDNDQETIGGGSSGLGFGSNECENRNQSDTDTDTDDDEPDKKCNHPDNVTCFQCLNKKTSDKKIKKLSATKNIFGFNL